MNTQALPALLVQGFQLHQAGRLAEAQACYRRLIAQDPRQFDALHLLGVATHQLGQPAEAIPQLRAALAVRADYAPAHLNLANSLRMVGQLEEAVRHYDTALALQPGYLEALSNRAVALQDLKQWDAALRSVDQAIAIEPRHAESHVNRGNVLLDRRRYAEAIASYDRALALNPRLGAAHYNRAEALRQVGRNEEAVVAYEAAIAIEPTMALAHFHRGNALLQLRRPEPAIAAFTQALALNPQLPYGWGHLLQARMLACDWEGVDALCARIEADTARGHPAAMPFEYLSACDSDALMHALASQYSAREHPPLAAQAAPARPQRRAPGGTIRLGYLCGEFRAQATAALMAGVWEAHDRSRFTTVAIDSGWDDGSAMRRRLQAAFDEFVDIAALDDDAAAARVAELDIDILVNLNGFFGRARQGVFARRAAPVQVNYLGYPGTIGAPYIDYIVADATVLPPASSGHFSEAVAWLPHSYQANDGARPIGDAVPQRQDCGLPAQGMVYACFNNSYKVTPAVFAAWMRVLQAVPGSVLWLLLDAEVAAVNLRRQAERAGVDPARLVFARRLPLADHLARHALADLFLDTWPCNAHTTASDALWAGLPLLTRCSGSFAGRVGASLLQALDMPELVTHDTASYERLAIELGQDGARLQALRQRLAEQRLRAPLFDTRRTTASLERAFTAMHERRLAGLPPAAITVEA